MSLVYSCTALNGTNKVGNLKPDANGYYRLCLGGLNVTSSGGKFYSYERNKGIFDNSSSFMRQVSEGNLYSEEDHPPFLPGMSDDEYIERICTVLSSNVCAHIKSVELVDGPVAANGEQTHFIYGLVKPDRGRGHLLKAALDNPDQNVCFSLRALCNDVLIGGRWVRTITALITFDWVIEPGLKSATKFNSAGLESFAARDIPITASVMKTIIDKADNGGVAIESAHLNVIRKAYAEINSAPKVSFAKTSVSAWK